MSATICPDCGCSLTKDEIVTVGRLEVDPCGVARWSGNIVAITGAQCQLLYALAKASPRPLSRETLLVRMPGSEDRELTLVSTQICHLRKRLADAGVPNIISNVWGVGYRLEVTA